VNWNNFIEFRKGGKYAALGTRFGENGVFDIKSSAPVSKGTSKKVASRDQRLDL